MKKFLLLLLMWAVMPLQVHAEAETKRPDTHSVQYDFEFYIDQDTTSVDVDLAITLTNLRSDVYIQEYSLLFPNTLTFQNLRITQEKEDIPFVQSTGDQTQRIIVTFAEPLEGQFASSRIKLHYTLENMHMPRGQIHEIILPLLVNDPHAVVNAALHLPEQFDKKISLSKPIPTTIDFRTIRWENVTARTLFMLFGESQTYAVNLGYSLKNTQLTSKDMEVAFPPETLYQRVFITSLNHKPKRTYTDDDGNFIGVFEVSPRETLDIQFKGYVQVFIRPQDSLREYMKTTFHKQQGSLLSQKPLWDIGSFLESDSFATITTPRDIYTYLGTSFSYAYSRLDTDSERYGAGKALKNPLEAVCTEYTDAFIGIAREKGIPAREIQGYGYSESSRIRPQSSILDELHAWPEYYDTQEELWIQIDPTWEDTSGIDYFSSLDVNHIALAIHGKDPNYPQPAGFYKTARRKDVNIQTTHIVPKPIIQTSVVSHISKDLKPDTTYTQSITVTNSGSTYIHSVAIQPQSQHLSFSTDTIKVEFLAPYESRDIPITFRVKKGYSDTDTVTFLADGAVLGTQDVRISSSRDMMLTGLLISAGVITALITLIIVRTHRTA